MTVRRTNETIEQFCIRAAWEAGHFWNPDNPEGLEIRSEADLANLDASMPMVIKALQSFSKIDVKSYAEAVLKVHHRAPDFDGQPGPAMENYASLNRCPVPDHVPPLGIQFSFTDPDLQKVAERMQLRSVMPAIGTGQWQGCHGNGGVHCAIIRWDQRGLPDHLQPVFLDVLKQVQLAYAEIGLLFLFTDLSLKDLLTGQPVNGTPNIDASFVASSDGWIGLAILGQNESCGDLIWCKYLRTFKGGPTAQAVKQQWVTLIMHELGHNCGRNHTNGGVMSPSLVSGLPGTWAQNDPSTNWMRQQFSGVPVPIPGGGTPPPPVPPSTIEQQIQALQVSDTVQSVQIEWLIDQVRKLKGENS